MIKCGVFSCGFTTTHCRMGLSSSCWWVFPPLHGVLHTINTSNFAWEAEYGSTEASMFVTTFESQGSLQGFTIGMNSIRAQIQRCPSKAILNTSDKLCGLVQNLFRTPKILWQVFIFSDRQIGQSIYCEPKSLWILTDQPMWDSWRCYLKRDVFSLKLQLFHMLQDFKTCFQNFGARR